MRLYHERVEPRTGALDTRDEEECFTPVGKRTGVWLSTEQPRSHECFVADVPDADVADYEVTAEDAEHRSFVVPGAVAAGLGFLLQD